MWPQFGNLKPKSSVLIWIYTRFVFDKTRTSSWIFFFSKIPPQSFRCLFPLNREAKMSGALFLQLSSGKSIHVFRWASHVFNVNEIVSKSYATLPSLVTMKRFGFKVKSMKLAYMTYVLPVLEYACSVRGQSVQLSSGLSQDIEAIQIRACKIMTEESCTFLEKVLELLGLESIHIHRQNLIIKFGQYILRSSKHMCILPPNEPSEHTHTRHTRTYQHSFVPFFTDLFTA